MERQIERETEAGTETERDKRERYKGMHSKPVGTLRASIE